MPKLIKNKLLTIFILSLVPLVLVLLPKATVPKDSLISPVKAQSSNRPYPIGWYDYIGHPNKLVEYATDGVSIVLPYNAAVTDDNTIRSYLDEAQRQGIKVIMDFRTPPVLCSPCPGPDELARKASLIKNHPALYAYYISDEPEFNGETAEKLKAIYRAIKSEDPNHPILIVHYHQIYPWNIYETWADAMDMLMIDWYPGWNCDQLGGGCDLEFDMMVRYSYSNWLNGVNWVERHRKQGFIAVPAGFGADKGAQDMTDAEYRFHVFSAMVLDTDAIVFWQYFGSHPPNNTIKPRIDRVIRQVQAIGAEMNNGTTNDPQITVSELDRNKLVYRYGVSGNRGVILAVNIARWDASDNSGQTLSNVQFTLPTGVRPSQVQVIGEDRDILVTNGTFTDNFSRFEVHAYAFQVDGSLPTSTPTLTQEHCPRKPQGDANCDGNIDGIDYSMWLNSQCRPSSTQGCASIKADFNNDGNIDDEDYTIWFKNSRT